MGEYSARRLQVSTKCPLFAEDSVSSWPRKAVPSRPSRAVTFSKAFTCSLFSFISLFLSVDKTDAMGCISLACIALNFVHETALSLWRSLFACSSRTLEMSFHLLTPVSMKGLAPYLCPRRVDVPPKCLQQKQKTEFSLTEYSSQGCFP